MDHVASSDIAEVLDVADLDHDRLLFVPYQRHPGLEDHVRSRLPSVPALSEDLARFQKLILQLNFVIWREEDDQRLYLRKCLVEHLTDERVARSTDARDCLMKF